MTNAGLYIAEKQLYIAALDEGTPTLLTAPNGKPGHDAAICTHYVHGSFYASGKLLPHGLHLALTYAKKVAAETLDEDIQDIALVLPGPQPVFSRKFDTVSRASGLHLKHLFSGCEAAAAYAACQSINHWFRQSPDIGLSSLNENVFGVLQILSPHRSHFCRFSGLTRTKKLQDQLVDTRPDLFPSALTAETPQLYITAHHGGLPAVRKLLWESPDTVQVLPDCAEALGALMALSEMVCTDFSEV